MKTSRAAFWALIIFVIALMPTARACAEQRAAAVKAAPQAISVSAMSLAPGESGQIQLEFAPADADARVSYTSNKKTVAKVSSAGVVKAVKPGTATITVKSKKGSAKAKLRVTVAYRDDGANYFFYGIGNADYRSATKLPGCIADLNNMAAVFGKARFAGRAFHTIGKRTNLTSMGIYALLAEMATNPNITEKDTTIFYFSGHGGNTGLAGHPGNGALMGVDGNGILVDEVRKYLDRVPGRVIVMLDSCLSGQFIQSKGASSPEEQAREFEQGVMNAFAPTGSVDSPGGALQGKALTDSPLASKYKILTACHPLESAYSFGKGSSQHGLFSRNVTAAIGAKRPADVSKDMRVTLNELYKYASAKVKAQVASYNRRVAGKDRISQRVMVWPPSDKSFVFAMD